MKKYLILVLALVCACFVFLGCADQQVEGPVATKPAPESSSVTGKDPGSAAAATKDIIPGKQLTIKLLDVEHGDCILLQGDGKTILIDTGDTAHNGTVLQKLRANNVKHIDALIISHYHTDHNGGFMTVVRNFSVGRIYDAGVVNPHSQFVKNLFAEYAAGKWAHTQLRRGQVLQMADGFYFEVLSPGEQLLPNNKGIDHYLNNNSLVLKLHYGKFSMMFTGDMEANAEYQVMANYKPADLHVDVLKVAHHGSRTSSTWNWLKTVRPTWGVISCGGDPVKYNHPHPKVLSTYEYLGIKVVTTKQNGDLIITTDGNTYDVHGSR